MAEVTLEAYDFRVVLVDPDRTTGELLAHAMVALKQIQEDHREIHYPWREVACVTTENKVEDLPFEP